MSTTIATTTTNPDGRKRRAIHRSKSDAVADTTTPETPTPEFKPPTIAEMRDMPRKWKFSFFDTVDTLRSCSGGKENAAQCYGGIDAWKAMGDIDMATRLKHNIEDIFWTYGQYKTEVMTKDESKLVNRISARFVIRFLCNEFMKHRHVLTGYFDKSLINGMTAELQRVAKMTLDPRNNDNLALHTVFLDCPNAVAFTNMPNLMGEMSSRSAEYRTHRFLQNIVTHLLIADSKGATDSVQYVASITEKFIHADSYQSRFKTWQRKNHAARRKGERYEGPRPDELPEVHDRSKTKALYLAYEAAFKIVAGVPCDETKLIPLQNTPKPKKMAAKKPAAKQQYPQSVSSQITGVLEVIERIDERTQMFKCEIKHLSHKNYSADALNECILGELDGKFSEFVLDPSFMEMTKQERVNLRKHGVRMLETVSAKTIAQRYIMQVRIKELANKI